jgi:dihydrofolate synthase/folylpolyglutamate synthase
VALEAVTRFLPAQRLEQAVVAEGFANVSAPGRLEALRLRGETAPPVVLDVAHNPDGVSAMISSLAEAFAFKKVRFVVGIARDKDYGGMLAEIGRVPASVVVTEPKEISAVPAAELKEVALELGLPCEVIEDVPSAVDTAIAQADPVELVCVTGSHYVVGEARSHLMHR